MHAAHAVQHLSFFEGKFYWFSVGEVAEWLKAAVLKTVEDASPSRVRISASPFF